MIGDRWGTTGAEVGRRYPCDDLVASPFLELWRAVTVHAPPDTVWQRLRQLRVAPYSYDWLDNAGRRSPTRLVDIPDPRRGDPFSRFAGRFDVGQVVSTEPGQHLTAKIMGALMSYVLVPKDDATRLLLKVVLPERRWYGPALGLGDWPMARRQLLNLKRLAESDARSDRRSRPLCSHAWWGSRAASPCPVAQRR